MKAQDFMNQDNDRARVVQKLIELCDLADLSYRYTEKKFTINLPSVEELPVVPDHPAVKRPNMAVFDQLGDYLAKLNGNLPDELPPIDKPLIDKPLNEGDKPEGDDEQHEA